MLLEERQGCSQVMQEVILEVGYGGAGVRPLYRDPVGFFL